MAKYTVNWRWRKPPEERYWAKVDKGGPDECWPWNASRDLHGYGWFRLDVKTMVQSHRYGLTLKLGREIREGYQSCHTCNNPPCCNPKHLYEGTPKENTQDSIRAGTFSPPPGSNTRGAEHPSARLTEPEVLDIYRRAWQGEEQMALAQEYGVVHHTINQIKLGKTWAFLTGHKRSTTPLPRQPPPDLHGEERYNSFLTDDQVREIYRRAWAGETMRALAKEFGFASSSAISAIKHGQRWQHITGHKRKE